MQSRTNLLNPIHDVPPSSKATVEALFLFVPEFIHQLVALGVDDL